MTNDEIYELYRKDADFKHYVESYCAERSVGIFEALAHITVKEVAAYYEDKAKDDIEPARQQASCDAR